LPPQSTSYGGGDGLSRDTSTWKGAGLRGTRLPKANLSKANLAHANLTGANLTGDETGETLDWDMRSAEARPARTSTHPGREPP